LVPDSFLPFLFTGQRFDPETQIYYYKERYFIPQWGRFASKDPDVPQKETNTYGYANARSNVSMDPFGKWIIVASASVGVSASYSINKWRQGQNVTVLSTPPCGCDQRYFTATCVCDISIKLV